MLQFSGTCYLTSAFNLVILGEYTKRIIIDAINMEMLSQTEDINFVKQPIEEGVCVDVSLLKTKRNRIKYYSKIFYNTICSTKSLARVNPASKDLFKEVSPYFSSTDLGFGGTPVGILFSIMMDLSINFWIMDQNSVLYHPYSSSIPVENLFTLFRMGHLKEAIGYLERVEEGSAEPDIIFFIKHDKEDIDYGENRSFPKPPENFHVETASIAVIYNKPDYDNPPKRKKSGHALCGFECDGYYKLFDSAYNIIENCDWTVKPGLKNNTYTRRMKDNNKWEFETIFIATAILVNQKRRVKYIEQGLCQF